MWQHGGGVCGLWLACCDGDVTATAMCSCDATAVFLQPVINMFISLRNCTMSQPITVQESAGAWSTGCDVIVHRFIFTCFGQYRQRKLICVKFQRVILKLVNENMTKLRRRWMIDRFLSQSHHSRNCEQRLNRRIRALADCVRALEMVTSRSIELKKNGHSVFEYRSPFASDLASNNYSRVRGIAFPKNDNSAKESRPDWREVAGS